MKKGLLTATLALAVCGAQAQSVVDTVSVGVTTSTGLTYPNQVWYSLPNDEQGRHDRTEWDFAIDLRNITSGAIINSTAGVSLWKYPKGNLANGWANVDTNGLSTWTSRSNSDTAWSMGAIGRYADVNNQLNLDWGNYDMTTHAITGDSLYIMKTAAGIYKKFAIVSLISGVYTFKYANLDGTSPQTSTITKTNYPGKNFAYFNIASNAILDREPVAANWDLLFTQYSALIPTAYTVTGVLINQGVSVAKVSNLSDLATNVNYSGQTFSTQMNSIGYGWKTFTGTTYTIKDSQLFFVRRTNGDIWKVVFKGFGGASNGNFIFSKEKIYTTPVQSVGRVSAANATVVLYPNPSVGRNVHVVYNFEKNVTSAKLAVYNLSGRVVTTAVLDANAGLHQYELQSSALRAGMYLIVIETGSGSVQQKLIVQ